MSGRILIISHAYAPMVSPRAFRWTSLAEEMVKRGYTVDVLCSATPGLNGHSTLNGVSVYRVGTAGLIGRLRTRFGNNYAAEKKQSAAATASAAKPSLPKKLLKSLMRGVYDLFVRPFIWPDFAAGWIKPAIKQASELIRQHDYDMVMTVSLPFSSHVVGLFLKAEFPEMRWLADVGDPFCFMDKTPVNNLLFYRRRNNAWDGDVAEFADVVSVTTEPTRAIYARLFPRFAHKYVVIPPLASLPEKAPTPENPFKKLHDKPLRLVFVGSLYKKIRSPAFLLKLFNALARKAGNEGLELHMVGTLHDTENMFRPYELYKGRQLFLHGLRPRDEAAAMLAHADVLVNIGNDTAYQLPSKVVEYAATGKPILNLIKSRNDSAMAFFTDYPAVLNVLETGNFDNIVIQVHDFISHLPKKVSAAKTAALLAPYGLQAVADAYLSHVKAEKNNAA
ncbi:MAG: glycosyltransferase [Proteobacteria bacterium]|nr:glycosyltransferase [Pseudomonadota bacterium]